VRPVSRGINRVAVTFDEPNLVANAGLLLVATLTARLGLERLANTTIDLSGRVGGFQPGRKILTIVHAMVAGASHIDHADMLRAGSSGEVLGHRVMAPSTLGTFLRAFTFGHVRQFERLIGEALSAAWALGAGPGDDRLVIDVDSTIDEVHGKKKIGAAYGYTKVLGYHPLLATWAKTGEILHARLRKGSANTQRGIKRFTEELIARVRRAGATGPIVMRFDSGFWSKDTIATLARLGVSYTMAVRTNTKVLARTIAGIREDAWTPIEYPEGGVAAVAETTYKGIRLVVRRTRVVGAQATLWPNWRHFAFLTDLEGPATEIDAFHRQHATVELAIDDWKEGAGMEHCPSASFSANGAWLCCAVLAHNLIRWTAALGDLIENDETLVVARTLRTRYFAVPARLVNRSGRPTLRMPSRWPWRVKFSVALTNLRAVTFAPT
jgi:Transposase DDE domain group 1